MSIRSANYHGKFNNWSSMSLVIDIMTMKWTEMA